jgi:hypothetical protein
MAMAISFFSLGFLSAAAIVFYMDSPKDFNFYDRLSIEYPVDINFDKILFVNPMDEKGMVISLCKAYNGARITELDNGSLMFQTVESEVVGNLECPKTIFISSKCDVSNIKDIYLLKKSTIGAMKKTL